MTPPRPKYVEEKPGNLPYLCFYQSKGGWPVFEMVDTMKAALALRHQFSLFAVRVEIFHWIDPTAAGG
jgi:hypothetical protein